MTNTVENDAVCGIYRTVDPIQNFRIRVRLERVASNQLLPSLPRLRIQNDLNRLLDPTNERRSPKTKLKEGKDSKIEDIVIVWQEKVFNRIEFNAYGQDPGPDADDRDRQYFKQIQKMRANGKTSGRIYTYVEGDAFYPLEKTESFLTDSPKEEPNHLTVGLAPVHRRRVTSKRNVINDRPTSDDKRLSRYSIFPYQVMYIMADLTDRPHQATAQLTLLPQPIEEHLLCKIQYFSNGTLIISPDFNTNRNGYIIETGTYYNEVYQYHLEFASMPVLIDHLKREKRFIEELCLRQQKLLEKTIGREFECPPHGVLKLNLFGEIISAKNFEYDDLSVYYQLDLPDNWYVDRSSVLSGFTPTASTTNSNRYDEIAYFSTTFEFEMWYRPPLIKKNNDFLVMPKLYLHVSSQDTWGRYRTEGYTYLDIPTFAGCYDEHLCCWRPYGNSIFDELRRYFIGSSAELDDLSAVAIPHMYRYEKEKTPFNRFGFRTVSTGEVHLRLHVVFQSENIALAHRKQRETPGVKYPESDSWMLNVRSVLDQFEEAKSLAQKVSEDIVEAIDPRSPRF